MNNDTLQELSLKFKGGAFNGTVEVAVSMKARTTMQVGGIAPLVIEPHDVTSLITALRILQDENAGVFILGGGSNIVVSDDGFTCAVISTKGLDLLSQTNGCSLTNGANSVTHGGSLTSDNGGSLTSGTISQAQGSSTTGGADDGAVFVTAGAGTSMARLVEYCTQHALTGMEQFAGLPGTVGGAVYMNARCFDREISDVLTGASYIALPSCGLVQHYDMNKDDWQYKTSPFQCFAPPFQRGFSPASAAEQPCRTPPPRCPSLDACRLPLAASPLRAVSLFPSIIISASFCVKRLGSDMRHIIEEKCASYIEQRRVRGHFRAPSSGSVFRNNHAFGKSSGALIDEAGLKGMTIGGAQIAPWHGNIIINTGNAAACDVASLVKAAHDAVQEKTGFDMVCEVVFCGGKQDTFCK